MAGLTDCVRQGRPHRPAVAGNGPTGGVQSTRKILAAFLAINLRFAVLGRARRLTSNVHMNTESGDQPELPLAETDGAIDESGLPLQPPSKVPGHLLLAGCVLCAIASAGMVAGDSVRSYVPRGLAGVGIVLGLVPSVAAPVGEKFEKRLGRWCRRLLWTAVVVALLSAMVLMTVIFPNLSP